MLLQRDTWRQAVEEADVNQDGKLSLTEFQVRQHFSLLYAPVCTSGRSAAGRDEDTCGPSGD